MNNDDSKKQEGAVTSLKDLNVSDEKKISNVIHGRKASTYLRIFRDDDGLTEIREAAAAAAANTNGNDDIAIEKLRTHNDDLSLRFNAQSAFPPLLEKRRKSLSLYDTHHKSSTLPKRKFSRSKDNLILTRTDSSSNNDSVAVNGESRSQQCKDSNGLKPTSSATYYPHKSETSAVREIQNNDITCDSGDDDDDHHHHKKNHADEITAIEEPFVPKHRNVSDDPTVIPSNDSGNYEAIETDEDYYDDEEEQDTDFPLAVELQPFTNNVGGHTAIFRFSKRAVCKALVNRENKWYENIELTHKELLQFMPRYIGVLNVRQHFHNKEDFLRELSSSTMKKIKENQHVIESGDGASKIGSALKHVHSFPCDTLFLEGQSLHALPEVVLNDNRHMIPDSLLGIYPNSPSSAPTDSYILSIGKDEDKDNDRGSNTTNNSNSNNCNNHNNSNYHSNSGSTTVNTKLKELVLQEVFAPTHNAATSSNSRRVNKKSRASSHENSRRGSNQSLKNALSQPATSPLLKRSLKDTISHALNSPSSVMDFKQFQQKEIARENSRGGSQKQQSSPNLNDDSSPLLQSNEAISPLSLPIDPTNNSEEAIFDMDDVMRNRLPEPAITSLDNRKHNESVTFEEHSDTIVSKFILLEDLTRKLHKPCALDLKMGTRQYGVDAKRSKQLSQREKCLKTTSRRLGVRICGLKIWNKSYYITRDKYFGRRVKIGWQFTRVLARFIYDGEQISSIVKQIPRLMRQLDTLASEISKLKGYRLYGSSLLLMYDGNNPGNKRCRAKVNLIDFARCVTKDALEQGYDSFRIPPKNPELEDRGFLRGIRSLKFYLMSIWNYLTSDSVLTSDDEELAQLLNENKEKFEQNWDWLDEFDKENEDEFNQSKSELRTKWRKYELIFDLEPRYGDDIDISD